MVSLSFGEFWRGEYEEKGYCLYVVRNPEALYVGRSVDIWERWFGDRTPHISLNFQGLPFGNSSIGTYVVDRLPGSLEWTIELWTFDDLKEHFNLSFTPPDMVLPDLKQWMIAELKPRIPLDYREDLAAAHRKIFG